MHTRAVNCFIVAIGAILIFQFLSVMQREKIRKRIDGLTHRVYSIERELQHYRQVIKITPKLTEERDNE